MTKTWIALACLAVAVVAEGGDCIRMRAFARRASDGRELYLGAFDPAGSVPKLADLPTDKLPAGTYAVNVRLTKTAEPDNALMVSQAGRSIIEIGGPELGDYEFSCRISDLLGFEMRAQPGLTQDSSTWNWYESRIVPGRDNGTSLVKDNRWTKLSVPGPISASQIRSRPLHDLSVRCEGTRFTVTIDGVTAVREDTAKTYANGRVAFRSPDSGAACYLDDVKIVDLKTGTVVFADDFSDGTLGKWRIAAGSWGVVNGYPVYEDVPLGTVTVEPRPGASFAKTRVERTGDDQSLFIGGQKVSPLFYRNCIGSFPYEPDAYDVMRRVYEAGMRIFAPIIRGNNLAQLDDVLAQIRIQCPDAYIMLSTSIPVPDNLPAGDHIRMMDGTSDSPRQQGLDDSKANNSVSMGSVFFRTNSAPKLVKRLVDHLRRGEYAPRIMGILVNGGGYEGGWGLGGMWPKYLLDLCDAQLAEYSAFLTRKYGSDAALQEAWGRTDVTLARPKVPSMRERTVSDIGGFRDPSRKENRWIDDIIDYYLGCAGTHRSVYEAVRAEMPHSFVTSFGRGCLNASFGIIQLRGPANAHGRDDLSCMVSLETYGDRGKGGVSVNANYGNESVRLSGHMHLQELDFRPPGNQPDSCPDWAALAGVFRREVAVQALMRKDALWFFDMGFTGPWYDHPAAYAEIAADARVLEKYRDVPRLKATEAALVQDGRQLKYYAMSPTPWTSADKIPWGTPIHYNENYSTHAPEGAVRLGAAMDGFNMNDLEAFKDAYKLYVFPVSGFMTSDERRQVRGLAERGATVVLMGPAGLVDETRASLDNMRELLGMRIAVGPIVKQRIYAVPGAGPIVEGLTAEDRLGSSRWYDGLMDPTWHSFFIDDPSVTPLATYADGRCALAERRVGKGRIVYSGVALTLPKVYRNLAKLAGVHIYLDTDDFTYADGNFVTVHARTDGVKHIVLRGTAPEVREIFTDEVVGRGLAAFDAPMKAGETKVWLVHAKSGGK